MNPLTSEIWSPYIVGVGIGVLVWFGFLLSNKAIGCSTAYARSFGLVKKVFKGEKVKKKPYYKKFVPKIDWEWMLRGEREKIELDPTKYIMITYWDSREDHEKFHEIEEIIEGFKEMMPYLAKMPFEEHAEIMH